MSAAEIEASISEAFEERAAIAEYCGGATRYQAERLAEETAGRLRRAYRLDLIKGGKHGKN
jgi:hypothetical protein